MAEKLTRDEYQKLQKKLEELKTVTRKEVSEKIKVALGFGDLSENSEYDSAKNEQAMVEAQILQYEKILSEAEILDESSLNISCVEIGNIVRIAEICKGKKMPAEEYWIKSSTGANPEQQMISNESPIGKALMGHKVGDVVYAETPGGQIAFEILEISLPKAEK
ncbi:MAG: transcription elongation factor GreA [Oscillospiraceae bacterium]|nr:transcription elongation factor GreA [Oscillospiraceae bacterium]